MSIVEEWKLGEQWKSILATSSEVRANKICEGLRDHFCRYLRTPWKFRVRQRYANNFGPYEVEIYAPGLSATIVEILQSYAFGYQDCLIREGEK
jgi:hypothetical protein